MKNKDENTRKRKTNHQPIFLSPSNSKSSDQTSVLRDVTNQNSTLPSSGITQDFTHPSTALSSSNPYYGIFSETHYYDQYYTVFVIAYSLKRNY